MTLMNRRHLLTRPAGTLAAWLLPASAASAKMKTVWGIAELWQWLYEKQPQLSENERWFGLDNHSLLPHLSGSPRLSLETI